MDHNEDCDAVEFEGELEYDDSDVLSEMETIVSDLFVFYEKWIETRTRSIEEIRAMARNLHACQRNIDITKAIGACIGATATLAGAFFTGIGLVLSPCSCKNKSRRFMGLGLGAGILGGAGVATSLVATTVKNTTERQKWKRFTEIIEADSVTTESLRSVINKYNRTLKSLQNITTEKEGSSLTRNIVQAVRGANKLAARISKTILKAGLRTKMTSLILPSTRAAIKASKILSLISILLGGISLILDIVYLMQVSIHIHDGSQSEVAKGMEEIADAMENELATVKEYILQILESDLEDIMDDDDIDQDIDDQYQSDDGFYDALHLNEQTCQQNADVMTSERKDVCRQADDIPIEHFDDFILLRTETDTTTYESFDRELYRLTPLRHPCDFDDSCSE